ncbi:hypothetical protein [Mycobacteroides abscessus]|uniref:hypothetical protein n=1 Tax=Mycobacteroides abscessus TaxID=36809 RepID=UPI0002587E29|nr:hypothetical protein [Mycobacteroides abscessus]EIC65492.1 hypothetical protein OUW_12409 [Mycobacteroides abscessus M93]
MENMVGSTLAALGVLIALASFIAVRRYQHRNQHLTTDLHDRDSKLAAFEKLHTLTLDAEAAETAAVLDSVETQLSKLQGALPLYADTKALRGVIAKRRGYLAAGAAGAQIDGLQTAFHQTAAQMPHFPDSAPPKSSMDKVQWQAGIANNEAAAAYYSAIQQALPDLKQAMMQAAREVAENEAGYRAHD